MSFVVISAIVWVVMQCLGELCAWVPVEGSSVPLYVKRYVEPSLAFAAGEKLIIPYHRSPRVHVPAANVCLQVGTIGCPF